MLSSKGEPYTADRFRAAWGDLMSQTPAGIRDEGYVFHGLRASSCEKLREAGCNDREIGAITGMSPEMITRYTASADQRMLARPQLVGWKTVKNARMCKTQPFEQYQ